MSTLVVGATGATGRLLVDQLINRGETVVAIVRSAERLPEHLRSHDNVSVVEASLMDLSDAEIAEHVKGCTAIASCLGHNLSLRGIFGPPRTLVHEAVAKLCGAIGVVNPGHKTKFVLMNTTANRNPDSDDRESVPHRLVIWVLRHLLPPQSDNEQAADFFRVNIGQDHEDIDWVAVRPDTLVDEEEVTKHEEYLSPIRDAVFNAGKTSRINVAHFMAQLITDNDTWAEWRGKMPVIYNSARS
jgi:putative NADH-flavin reductase